MPPQTPASPAAALPAEIRERLALLRRRWVRLTVLRGVSVALIVFFVAMVLGMALDRFFFLPPLLRNLLLPVALAAAGIAAWLRVVSPVRRRIGDPTVAAWVEAANPNLEERLLSAVGLPEGSAFSSAFVSRVVEEASAISRSLPFARSLAAGPARRAGVVALSAVLFLAIACLSFSDVALLAARFLRPGANLPRASRVRLEVRPGDAVVPSGDAFSILVRATGSDPARAWLYRDDGRGASKEAMERSGLGAFAWTLPAASRDFTYFVRSGDAETARFRVRVRPRPEVVTVSARVRPPAYANASEESLPALDELAALAGSEAGIEASASESLREATLEISGGERIPMEVDGRRCRMPAGKSVAIRTEGSFRIHVTSVTGLSNKDPAAHRIRLRADEPPKIAWASPSADAVLPAAATLPVSAIIEDDLGVADVRMTVSIVGGTNAARETDVSIERTPPAGRRIQVSGRLDLAALGARSGDEAVLRVEARDARPASLGGPGLSCSVERRIRIVAGATDVATLASIASFAAARAASGAALESLAAAASAPNRARATEDLRASMERLAAANAALAAGAGTARSAGDADGARDLSLLAEALAPIARDGPARALAALSKDGAQIGSVAAPVSASRGALARWRTCLSDLHAARAGADVARRLRDLAARAGALARDAAGLSVADRGAVVPAAKSLADAAARTAGDWGSISRLTDPPEPAIAEEAGRLGKPASEAAARAAAAGSRECPQALGAAGLGLQEAADAASTLASRLERKAAEARRILEGMRDPVVAIVRKDGTPTKADLEAAKKALEAEAAKRKAEAAAAAALAEQQEALKKRLAEIQAALEALAARQDKIAEGAKAIADSPASEKAADPANQAADQARAAADSIRSDTPAEALPKQGAAEAALGEAAKAAPGAAPEAKKLASDQKALAEELKKALADRAAALAALQKDQVSLQKVAAALASEVAKAPVPPASMTAPGGTNAPPPANSAVPAAKPDTSTPTPSSGSPPPPGFVPPPGAGTPPAVTGAPGTGGAGSPGIPALTPPTPKPPDLSNEGLGAGSPGLTGKSSLAEGGQQSLPGAPSLPGGVASAALGGAVQRMDAAAEGIVEIPKSAEDAQTDAVMLLKYASQVLGEQAAAAAAVASAIDPNNPPPGLEGFAPDNVKSPFEGIVAPGGAIDIQGGGFEAAKGIPLPGSAFGTSAAGQTVPTAGVSIGGFTGGGPGGAPAGGVPLAAGGEWNGTVLEVKWKASEWGRLPGHLKTKMEQARPDAFPPDYESRIREYFQTISEKAGGKK